MQGFTTRDRAPSKTGGIKEVITNKKGNFVNQSKLAQSNNSGGSPSELRPLHPLL